MTEEPTRIINEQAQPVHITLTKNTKGYQWEISVYGVDPLSAFGVVQELDTTLKAKYGAESAQ